MSGHVAHIRLTRVRLYDSPHLTPRVGDRGTLSLRNGIFTDSLTGQIYCTDGVMRCGA